MTQEFFYVMTVVFILLGIMYQVVIGVCYQKMIQASDGISGTNNKLMTQCKERYVACYERNGGMSNTNVFVDKYVGRIKFMGLTIHFIKNLSMQLVLAGVFVAGFGIFRGMMEKRHISELLPYYIISLFGVYLFLSVTAVVDVNGRKQMLKANLIDYLENDVLIHLEREKEKKETEVVEISKQNRKKEEQPKAPSLKEQLTPEETKTLEELVRSLFV